MLAGALERKPEDRPAYLNQACAEQSLREEVESLLAAHEKGESDFLERPASGSGGLEEGSILGSYQILGMRGSDGMGVANRIISQPIARE